MSNQPTWIIVLRDGEFWIHKLDGDEEHRHYRPVCSLVSHKDAGEVISLLMAYERQQVSATG